MNSSDIGGRTEAVVLAELAKAGFTVLIPFGVARYDMAIDDRTGDRLKTVQCKSGRLRGGCIVWNACSQDRSSRRVNYRGQVDYFGVWCSDTGDVFLVPVEDVGPNEGRLRVLPALNGQKARIRSAEKYKITK
jgi:hypothetical protein